MSVSITLRFDYPWLNEDMDENDISSCLSELSPEELIATAQNEGYPINIDVEVY